MPKITEQQWRESNKRLSIIDRTLRTAIFKGDWDAAHIALCAGANPNETSIEGVPFLMLVTRHCINEKHFINRLIHDANSLMSKHRMRWLSPEKRAMEAARPIDKLFPGTRVFLTLLQRGARVDQQETNTGRTALHYATGADRYPRTEATRLLLAYNADPNLRDNKGRTALHYASEWNDEDAIEMLLDDPRTELFPQDNHGKRPHEYLNKEEVTSAKVIEWMLDGDEIGTHSGPHAA